MNEFIIDIEKYVNESIKSIDKKKRLEFYRSISKWFLNISNVEWFNVLQILKTNPNATCVNTLERWRIIALKMTKDNSTKVMPNVGSKTISIWIPFLSDSSVKWEMKKVFDISSLVGFPKQFSIISRLSVIKDVENILFDINDYIERYAGVDNFLNDYVSNTCSNMSYSKQEIELLKEIILYALVQTGNYYNSSNKVFELNGDVITSNCLEFIHDVHTLLDELPSYLVEKMAKESESILEEQRRYELLSRANRCIKERRIDALIKSEETKGATG